MKNTTFNKTAIACFVSSIFVSPTTMAYFNSNADVYGTTETNQYKITGGSYKIDGYGTFKVKNGGFQVTDGTLKIGGGVTVQIEYGYGDLSGNIANAKIEGGSLKNIGMMTIYNSKLNMGSLDFNGAYITGSENAKTEITTDELLVNQGLGFLLDGHTSITTGYFSSNNSGIYINNNSSVHSKGTFSASGFKPIDVTGGSFTVDSVAYFKNNAHLSVSNSNYRVKYTLVKKPLVRKHNLPHLLEFGTSNLEIDGIGILGFEADVDYDAVKFYAGQSTIKPFTNNIQPIIYIADIYSTKSLNAIHIQDMASVQNFDVKILGVESDKSVGINAESKTPVTINGKVKIQEIKGETVQYQNNNIFSQLDKGDFGTAVGVRGGNITFANGLIVNQIYGSSTNNKTDRKNAVQYAIIADAVPGTNQTEPIRVGMTGLVKNGNGTTDFNLVENSLNVIEGDLYAFGAGIEAAFASPGFIETENPNNPKEPPSDKKWVDSSFTGCTVREEGMPLELLFKNGGTWFVTADSDLSALRLHENGVIDLTRIKEGKNPVIHTEWLQGVGAEKQSSGKLLMHYDWQNQDSSSQVIANAATGRIEVQLSLDNYDNLSKKSDVALIIENPTLPDGSNFTVAGEKLTAELTYKPGGAIAPKLKFFEEGSSADSQGLEQSTGKGGWYLVFDSPDPNKPNPDQGGQTKPPVTDEVDQVLSLGTSLTQAVGMLSETEDLRMRMGDVRHGDTDGLWVRTYSRKDSAHGSFGNGFAQDVHGFQMGADHVIRSNDNASWVVGGAFHYGKSDIEGAAEAGGGDADIDQYTFKAYATYMKDNGAFADIVLHTGYYDTTLTGKDNTGLGSFKADYSNWGYGVSAEVGHRFDLSNIANSWYVEPTAQLTWFHAEGKNFKTSTGLEINQGDADFITGRLGAAVGKVFALGTANDPMSSYFSVAMKGGMLYQFNGDQTITAHGTDGATVVCADAMDMKGARAYYGITADWKIDDTWRIYGQISREEGSGYTKDYDASIGVRYAF